MPNSPLIIYPTMVIGLGGTGTNVARYVKRRFLRTWNTFRAGRRADDSAPVDDRITDQEDLPSVLQILAVDTEPLTNEPEDQPLYFHEFAYLGRFDATRLVQNRANHRPFLDWWTWNEGDIPLGYIHNGAKQLRPVGRLAFFRNYPTFRAALVSKLAEMRVAADIKSVQSEQFQVAPGDLRVIYIVGSLCGGTGAGMFLDVAHTVRHYARNYNVRIVGIFLLPSVFTSEIESTLQQGRIQANAYAALRELNHWHIHQGFRAHYPSEKAPIPTDGHRAFEQIFLIERNDTEGLALSGKAATEQMVAHMIHLTAFSTVAKTILARDVNVTGERHITGEDLKHTYLSYSSFGVSGLVIPRQALWRYFVQRAIEDVIARLFTTQPDHATVWARYGTLVGQIQDLFRRQAASVQSLQQLDNHISRGTGPWPSFLNALHVAGYELLQSYGLQGLNTLLSILALDPGDQTYREQILANRRPNEEVPAPENLRLLDRVNVAALQRHERQVRAHELGAERLRVWRLVADGIRNEAIRWQQHDVTAVSRGAATAMQAAGRRRQQAAQEIHPLQRTADNETGTYYDLETGAVGRHHLQDFWSQTSSAINDYRPSLMQAIYARLAASQGALPEDLPDAIAAQLASIPGLRDRVNRSFDVRDVIYLQTRNGVHDPDYRLDQLMQPTRPHETVDGDTRYYSTAVQEPIRVVTTPPGPGAAGGTAGAGAHLDRDRRYRRELSNYEGFTVIETNDLDRVDAVYIVHGIPVGQIASLDAMRGEYGSGEFPERILHLDPSWLDPNNPDYLDPLEAPPAAVEPGPAGGGAGGAAAGPGDPQVQGPAGAAPASPGSPRAGGGPGAPAGPPPAAAQGAPVPPPAGASPAPAGGGLPNQAGGPGGAAAPPANQQAPAASPAAGPAPGPAVPTPWMVASPYLMGQPGGVSPVVHVDATPANSGLENAALQPAAPAPASNQPAGAMPVDPTAGLEIPLGQMTPSPRGGPRWGQAPPAAAVPGGPVPPAAAPQASPAGAADAREEQED